MRTSLIQIGIFYAACLCTGFLLSLGDFRGARISLELGTGGYIDNLKFGGVAVVSARVTFKSCV